MNAGAEAIALEMSHKTAIGRPGKMSAPMRFLYERGLLIGRVLDYGCGKGQDADHLLGKCGVEKFDPHFFPPDPNGKYDTIICSYVLNTLGPKESKKVLGRIKGFLSDGGTGYIVVRRDVKRDGFTVKGTYQRNVELDLPVEVDRGGRFAVYRLEN